MGSGSDDVMQTARETLCNALSQDLADSFFSSSDGIQKLAEALCVGVQGYSSMTNFELVVAVYEAGLDSRYASELERIGCRWDTPSDAVEPTP